MWTLPTKAGEERALTPLEETLVAVLTLCQDSLGLLCLSPPSPGSACPASFLLCLHSQRGVCEGPLEKQINE